MQQVATFDVLSRTDIGLEVKRPGTYQSPGQKVFERELTEADGG
jgi:carbohydrate-binding DOMON domain-containing protein